ncbi:hypothetical protein QBC37DRAFT_431793 [Rhypophila decipiens]|uniref:NmrA-like domain-containing protein n=1 Tax=Rhypophila decipiens TaxID=261697 RepID=A0AAN6XXK1_9PEZI|nr:hypothetical protein QBC37DRAFT_431793 [Rhypophila decipiens]
MSSPKVIVFGPTGGVGLPTAITAAENDAKVYLAMRDPSKPLVHSGTTTTLTESQETSLGFERVKADFSDPSSVESAVRTTGAKRAFIYLLQPTPQANAYTKESIKALKSAGVEFVVFLSSASIAVEDLNSIKPSDVIEYAHAQVELNLEEVFGAGAYAAVRPAYFASNIFWWVNMVKQGEVTTVGPEVRFDWIVSEDIGRVSGKILAQGPSIFDEKTKKSPIYLHGPKIVSFNDAMKILGKVLGKEIKVTSVDLEEAVKAMVEVNGMPEFLARAVLGMVDELAKSGNLEAAGLYTGRYHEEGMKNHELYMGKKSTELEEYLEKIKGTFA